MQSLIRAEFNAAEASVYYWLLLVEEWLASEQPYPSMVVAQQRNAILNLNVYSMVLLLAGSEHYWLLLVDK